MLENPRPSSQFLRSRRLVISLVLLLVVVLGVGWSLRGAGRPGSRGGPSARANMAVPVRVVAASTRDMAIFLRSLGTVTAYNTVTVRSRVSGELVKVAFQEGQRVQAGDLLAQIDPRAFDVALAQARGVQQQNLAQLENARRDLKRYKALYAQDSIARQQLETQAALVHQYEGTVKSDQATVDNAKLQLTYARITAPISGRLGLRLVDEGNLVSTSDTNGLVVITQTQPIAVVFTLPETQLPQVLASVRTGHTLTVEAYDRADLRPIAMGTLETVDNQIDVTTGTVKLKARFDNADEALFPNQFVNTRLHVQTLKNAAVIPAAAVQRGSIGAFVFLLQADSTVIVQPVELGPADADMMVVKQGLKPGDQVVIEGTDRLRTGTKVEVATSAPSLPNLVGSGGLRPSEDNQAK